MRSNVSAEEILNLISDGNVSEADLSDDEGDLLDEFANTVGVHNLYIAEILT